MTPAQIASATDAELRAIMNAPRSDGETILSEKSGEWARRYQETNDSADLAKAMDCARASLTLYNERMAADKVARAEWMRRQNVQPTTSTNQTVTTVGPMRATCPRTVEYAAACICGQHDSADTYGTPAHEQALIAEERESDRWASANLQDAYSQIGKRETEGLADA